MSCPIWIMYTIFYSVISRLDMRSNGTRWIKSHPPLNMKRGSRNRYRETKTQEISRQPLFSKCHFFIISSTCVCSKSFNKVKCTSHAEKYIEGEFWIVQWQDHSFYLYSHFTFLNYFFNIYFVIVMKYQQNILKIRLIVAYNKKQCCDCPKSWAQGLLVPG